MRFSQQSVSATNYYLTIMDLAANKVFDFASSTWATLAAAVTPGVAMTEVSIGTQSDYHANIDLTLLYGDMVPRDFVVTMYKRVGATPAPVTDTPQALNWPIRVCAGFVVPSDPRSSPFRVDVSANYTTTLGTSMHLTAELVLNGATINLATLDPAATCTFIVTADASASGGARVAVFTVPASGTGGVGPANSASRFEAEFASPGLASNHGFTVAAQITTGGVVYGGSCKLNTF